MAGKWRILVVSVLFLSLSALAATFQWCGFLLSLLMIKSRRQRQLTVTWTRPWLGGLPYLESFTWQNTTRLTGLPHLSCKHDQIKIRDYMERPVTPPTLVTSPTWGPPPPCKQALTRVIFFCTKHCYSAAGNTLWQEFIDKKRCNKAKKTLRIKPKIEIVTSTAETYSHEPEPSQQLHRLVQAWDLTSHFVPHS